MGTILHKTTNPNLLYLHQHIHPKEASIDPQSLNHLRYTYKTDKQ